LENQKKLREFIARLARRQSTRAKTRMFFPLSETELVEIVEEEKPEKLVKKLDDEGALFSGSGALISARQAPQNSTANRIPHRIRATKKLETMARPQKV